MGRSIAAVTPAAGGGSAFEKQAPTVSYGSYADDLLVTLRRTPEAEPGDQVLALARKEQIALEPTGTWDPLGMRGTCSPGYVVRATLAPEQILPTPFSRAMAESMVPVSHILWSQLWLGIATDAFDRARAFVRAAAKKGSGEPPPTAVRLSHVMSELSLLRAEVGSALAEFVEASEEPGRERLLTMACCAALQQPQDRRLRAGAARLPGRARGVRDRGLQKRHAVQRRQAPTRHDVRRLMIANERIHQINASLLLIAKDV